MMTEDIQRILNERPRALFMVKSIRSATWGHPCVVEVRHGHLYARTVLRDGLGSRWRTCARDIQSVTLNNYEENNQ